MFMRRAVNSSIKFPADRVWLVVLFALMVLLYGAQLGLALHPPALRFELTFNSMLEHMLAGRFDVDADIVGGEGFLRNGHVYAYWGIWCALLRLPLWLAQRMNLDMTGLSCLLAACIAGLAKARTVLLVRKVCAGQGSAVGWIVPLTLGYILLGGAGLSFLYPILYQEVSFWAAAFGAVFVYCAIKGLLLGFDQRVLSAMSACAGLALLTRVSTGIGLIAALGLLLLMQCVNAARDAVGNWKMRFASAGRMLLSARMLAPLAILLLAVAITGYVNDQRWASATTFADYRYYIDNQFYPDRQPKVELYGLFNLQRIPMGLVYYFLPLWAFPTSPGHYFMEETHNRLMSPLEMPPSSFLLTDLFAFCLIGFLVVKLWRGRDEKMPRPSEWLPLAAGLRVPCLLMLCALSMCYRYRMEFYPEFDLLAFLGLIALFRDEKLRAFRRHAKAWMAAALAVSILSSAVVLVMYKFAPWGNSLPVLKQHHGLVSYYVDTLRAHTPGRFLRLLK